MNLFFRVVSKIAIILSFMAGCATTDEIKEPNSNKLLNQGKALYGKGQYDRAIVYFNKAIEINPRYAEAYYYRGLAYQFKGQYDKAIADYNMAIDINPSIKGKRKELESFSGSASSAQVAAILKLPNKFDGRWELDSKGMFYMHFNIKDGKIIGKMGNATWPKDIHLPIRGKVSQEGKFMFEYAGHLDVSNGYELEVTNASAERGFIEGYAYDDFNKGYTWKVFRK